jgi:hypothetical protein
MDKLYSFPKNCYVGSIISKTKIYQQTEANTKIKNLFTKQVSKIIWSYKLAPDTINLEASSSPSEIQIISIKLMVEDIAIEILQAIDQAIPSTIIFELQYHNKIKYVASYSANNKNTKTQTDYLQSCWLAEDTNKTELPVALNMQQMHQSLLLSLSPLAPRRHENFAEFIERLLKLQHTQQQANKLEKKVQQTKQFNAKVKLNHELNLLKQEINNLIQGE